MNIKNERANIIKFLYLKEITNFDFSKALESYNIITGLEFSSEMGEFLEELISKFEEIDEIIKTNLKSYTISRLNIVDLQIIRLATYEMKFTDLARTIIINEAILLSKEYSEIDDFVSSKFNNKLIDQIKVYIDGQQDTNG